MKKVSLIVHQSYVEDVIKNLHETGMMEIIDVSREEPTMLEDMKKASMHPEAGVCTTYELSFNPDYFYLHNTEISCLVEPRSGGTRSAGLLC